MRGAELLREWPTRGAELLSAGLSKAAVFPIPGGLATAACFFPGGGWFSPGYFYVPVESTLVASQERKWKVVASTQAPAVPGKGSVACLNHRERAFPDSSFSSAVQYFTLKRSRF